MRVLRNQGGGGDPGARRSSGARAKLVEWVSRYGFAECAGIGGALLGAILVRDATGSALASAYGGAWGESLGYASVIIVRDYLTQARALRVAQRSFALRHALQLAI